MDDASFDLKKAEVTIDHDPSSVNADRLLALAQEAVDEETIVVLGADRGFYLPAVEFPEGLDVAWISRNGSAVSLEQHVEPGQITIFDFWAEWCGPCRQLDEILFERLRTNNNLSVRKLNVIDWESDVAKALLAGVPGLPYVEVWTHDEANGARRIGSVQGLYPKRLDRLLRRAQK